ncbi:nucleoside recognition domain protein [Pseudodesulfovibrio mercurii]|uniref:Nucleoside recognition domain protein n=1 Tax=Pseudodesulfovibrio mercurii TaxID=641491 RepID=F0JG04_9BACT|nr:membrane protein [Pseudodesulfovibrio mercurii]EGB15000.1 nucleoside recognition domain protein [Pseudodesulfovibrio mercurii]
MTLDLSWPVLWNGLFWPLIRLTFYISVALMVGILIESLNWTRYAAKLAEPLARRARLKDISAASFTMAFFSGLTANTMLAEAHEKGELSDRELVLSNLFNSLPTYFLHLPTIFFIASPFIGSAAYTYVGLTALASVLRTMGIVLAGKFLLPPLPEGCLPCRLAEIDKRWNGHRVKITWVRLRRRPGPVLRILGRRLAATLSRALRGAWKRFTKRLPKILYLTCPIYALFFVLKQLGLFAWLQSAMAGGIPLFTFLPPEALSIVAFHMAAEFTAGLAVASALIADTSLTQVQVILALMLGNVLSSPVRAFRHQFPYYAGIFRPRMAFKLILYNQVSRSLTIALVGAVYALIMH